MCVTQKRRFVKLCSIQATQPLLAAGLRVPANFLNPINLICPVQSPPPKIFPFPFPPNHPHNSPTSSPLRGAYRDRHETLGWGAVDAAALGAQACSQGGFP